MAALIVTYDLSAPGRNYQTLLNKIKEYPWAKITESSYAVATTAEPAALRDYLQSALDSDDRLFVGRLGASAWTGLPQDISTWLLNNI